MNIKYITPAFILLSFFLFNCSKSPDVEVEKAEFAEYIYFSGMNLPPFIKGAEKVKVAVGKNGIRCTYENHHIIRLTLNFRYKPLDIKDELGSDRYRSKVFTILQKNSHMYNGNNVVKSIWGYWPKEVTETNAYEMTLFYLIPTSSDLSKLRFEYDKSILGGTGGIFVFDKFADMEALEVKG